MNGDASITITGGYVDDSIVGGGNGYAANTNVDVAGKSIISISGQDFDMGWYDVKNNKECGSIYGGSWPDRDPRAELRAEAGSPWKTVRCFATSSAAATAMTKNSGRHCQGRYYPAGSYQDRGILSLAEACPLTPETQIQLTENVTITMTDCEAAAVIGGGASPEWLRYGGKR